MMKSDRMMPMTGPMALLCAGPSSAGSLVISAGGRAGRDGGRQPKRGGSPGGGGRRCVPWRARAHPSPAPTGGAAGGLGQHP